MKLRQITAGIGLLAALSGAANVRLAAADTSISDIQLGVVLPGTFVQVDGVVVTAVGKFGYFIQEPNPAPGFPNREWTGVWVFTNANHTVHKGDVVNVSGTTQEYFDFTEVDMTIGGGSTTLVGTAPIPAPVNLLISEINDTGALAEAYEGVLVRVDRLDSSLFARALDTHSEWYISTQPTIGAGDSILVDNYSALPGDDFEYDYPGDGTQLTFLQGPLVYNFAHYKIAPRNCETDMGGPCKPVLKGAYSTGNTTMNVQFGVNVDLATSQDPNNYELGSGFFVLGASRDPDNHKIVHLTTESLPNGQPEQIIVNGVESEGGLLGDPNQTYSFRSGITPIHQIQFVANPAVDDVSPVANEVVTVQARIAAVEGNYYYLQDGAGGQWDGIYCRVAKTGTIAVGQTLRVAGLVNEFNGATQMSYRSGVDYFQNLGGSTTPTVSAVTAAQVKYRSTNKVAEPYEYSLVKISNATVDSLAGVVGPYFDEWLLRQAPDTAGCDLNGITGVSYDACIGDRVDMTGILRYAFTQYRIMPRSGRGGDITVIFDNPTCAPTAAESPYASATILAQARPNPFERSTEIVLSLPHAGAVSLEIMDVAGRLITRLAEGDLPAGSHVFRWDGRDGAGHRVAAGTYFYLLRSGAHETSRRMLMVR